MNSKEQEKKDHCLDVSHKLLKHYSELLNQYDQGQRSIPHTVEDWVERCWKVLREGS